MVTHLFPDLNPLNSFPNHNKDNKIGDGSVAPLGKALRFNKALKVLNLSGTHLHFHYSTLKPCERLSFDDNKIGNEGVKHIAKGIKFNTSLEKLDLSGVK